MTEYRILICGDRNWIDFGWIYDFVASLPEGTIIIEGEARGADALSRTAAEKCGLEVLKFPADWSKGKVGGILRNIKQLEEGRPTHVVAFHNDLANSKGTKHMVSIAIKAGIPTYSNVKSWADIELGLIDRLTTI